jgi:hypothetical protein
MRESTRRFSGLVRRGAGVFPAPRSFCLTAAGIAVAVAMPISASAQWVTVSEPAQYMADHNWSFRQHYPTADRLFNAFDYGHAILYELLWTRPNAPASLLEEEQFDFLTQKLLASPPDVPVLEEAIAPRYARLAPEAKAMFEWAHVLHRQLYDVLGDPRLTDAQRDTEVARVMEHYFSRPDLAFSRRPKSMDLMQGQEYSLAFRKGWPKFNGLIWAYHWLQVGLYEPLVVGRDFPERRAMVDAAVARFRQMLVNPPSGMPHQMPMTSAVAPSFALRYPEAAIVFDNLHSMHDVITDILASPEVPRDRKRAEILRAARLYRDDTSYVMSTVAWQVMSEHMGVNNQGGSAVRFMPELPTPTVSYGAVMLHDPQSGEMIGMSHGELLQDGDHDMRSHGAGSAGGHDDKALAGWRHEYEALPNGGRIVLRADSTDEAALHAIREHVAKLQLALVRGDLGVPELQRLQDAPGAKVMAERHARIHYGLEQLADGAALAIHTTDEAALAAVHAFLAFQREQHEHGAHRSHH